MNDYIKDYLKSILSDDVSDDIVEYISTMKHVEDYEEFMENIVDLTNSEHVRVYEALKDQLFGTSLNTPKTPKQLRDAKVPFQTLNDIQQVQPSPSGRYSGGKKKKYHNFYTQDHKPGLLKGRHPCNCQTVKHDLINNCTKCGRIVCAQEGSGPCFFCDNMVCTRHEMEVLNSRTKDSDKLYNHLVEQKKSKEWKKAIETRNRLVETDKMGDLIKNKVFDDQNDYFDMDSKWLSEGEKSNLKKKHAAGYSSVHKSRRAMKLALDFASRTVTIDKDEHQKYKKNLLVGVNKLLDTTENRFPRNLFDGDKGQLIADIVKLFFLYTEHNIRRSTKPATTADHQIHSYSQKIEDNKTYIVAFANADETKQFNRTNLEEYKFWQVKFGFTLDGLLIAFDAKGLDFIQVATSKVVRL